MLVYVLDPFTFQRVAVIENYVSCIWTERFINPGEVKLTVPGTHDFAALLRPGTLLENEDSTIPMLVETRETKSDNIVVSGRSLEAFFDERSLTPRTKTGAPGHIMGALVDDMQTRFSGAYAIYGVYVGTSLADGDDVTEKIVQVEKVHSLLLRIAQKYVVDMEVRRFQSGENSDGPTYAFEFTTRKGVDRTNGNPDDLPTVRFSPRDDNFENVNEVYSDIDRVHAVIVHPPRRYMRSGRFGYGRLNPVMYPVSKVENLDLPPFGSRVVGVDSEKIDLIYIKKRLHLYTSASWDLLNFDSKSDIVESEMRRLAEAEYKKYQQKTKRAVDGEVTSTVLKYGRDYHLGDLVEVEGAFSDGVPFGRRSAMVSEYIRTSDESGKRSYPTLSAPIEPAPYEGAPSVTVEEKIAEKETEHLLQPFNNFGFYDAGNMLSEGTARAYIYNDTRVKLAGSIVVDYEPDVDPVTGPDAGTMQQVLRLPEELRPSHMVNAWVSLVRSDGSSTSDEHVAGWIVKIHPAEAVSVGADYSTGLMVVLENPLLWPHNDGNGLPQVGDILSLSGLGWDLESNFKLDGSPKP